MPPSKFGCMNFIQQCRATTTIQSDTFVKLKVRTDDVHVLA